MLNQAYFVRQIRTLLKFANLTTDPHFAAFLLDKALHLKSQVEDAPPATDASASAPDGERRSDRT